MSDRAVDPAPPDEMRRLFASAGEVGRYMLALDWAKTPLGPVEQWPQSLRTAVSIVLPSRHPLAIWWGPELVMLYNDALAPSFGEKHPGAIGRPGAAVLPEMWDVIGPMMAQVLADGEPTWRSDEPLPMTRRGFLEDTYWSYSYSPVRDEAGAVAGVFTATSETTARVLTKRRLQIRQDLASVLANTSEATSATEVCTALTRVLARWPADVPYAAVYLLDDQQVAHLVARTSATPPQLPPTLDTAKPGGQWPLHEALAAGTLSVLEEPGEHMAWAGPPSQAPRAVVVVPIAVPGGAGSGAALLAGTGAGIDLDAGYERFFTDLAAQTAAAIASARAYETQRTQVQALAELDAAKTTFFTNVSHELRTPLTLILGPVEDLLTARQSSLSAADRSTLHLAAGNAARLLHLVNTLLDFARASDGRAQPVFQPVDIARLTQELCAMFDSAISRAGLTLTCRVEPVDTPVWVDVDAWTKIVSNLLSNALKHTFAGEIAVDLREVVQHAVATVELSVRDTGTGIPAEELPHLFDRFHRVAGARARSHEGTGIGLALTAELVAAHRGSIDVDSSLGSGSTFAVRIPTERPDVPEQQIAGGDRVASTASAAGFVAEMDRWLPRADTESNTASGGGADAARGGETPAGGTVPADAPRVLVVDDSPDMRAYLVGLLAEHYRVLTAADGAEALATAHTQVPDLVLTDVMMPVLDGFGLLAALRADPATAGIPVVMLSARAGAEGIADGLEAGADDYLSKPFSARELLARVRANLELDRSRRIRAELEESRDLLDQAQRLARLGSWKMDLRNDQVRFSAQLCRMLELDPAQDLMTRQEAFAFLHPDDVDRVEQALAEGITGGAPVAYEARFRTTAGREVLSEILGEVERDPHGTAVLIRGSVQDITAARRLEEATKEAAVHAAVLAETADREHRIADELQAALLPPARFDSEHLQVLGYYRAGVAGTRVGGDWYDVIDLGAGRTALTVGDVMGRGVRAAALMGQVRSVVRTLAHLHLPPAELLARADELVADLAPDSTIVTCLYAVHDPALGRVGFATAGHMPPLLCHADGDVQVLEIPAAPPLGTGRCNPTEHHVPVAAGDILALYTDGLVEHRGRPLEPAIARLGRAISRWTPGQALHPLVDALLPEGSEDDVALLVARITTDQPCAQPPPGQEHRD